MNIMDLLEFVSFENLLEEILSGGGFGDAGAFQDYLNQNFWYNVTFGGSSTFLLVLGILLAVLSLGAWYTVTSFKWQFIGRKAGLQKDWMPFVPFARTVYKLSIVDEAWWKMFFMDMWFFFGPLLYMIIRGISNNQWTTFAIILVALYWLCCLAYTVYWRYKFYMAHNIRPHFALVMLCPPLKTICVAWDYIIAFGRNYPFTGEGTSRQMMDVMAVPQMRDAQGQAVPVTQAITPSGKGAPWAGAPAPAAGGTLSITGLSGMYAGQALPLAANEELVIGRDNAMCNLIIDKSAEKVSRKHCAIFFDAARGTYQVTDFSSNGTFVDGGSRLVANMPTTLQRGTVIVLGSKENRFRLD